MWRWSQRRELTMPFSWPVWTNGSRSTMQTQTSTGSAMQMIRTLSGTQKRNWWPRTSTAASLKPLTCSLLRWTTGSRNTAHWRRQRLWRRKSLTGGTAQQQKCQGCCHSGSASHAAASPCLFVDICELGGDVADCAAHGQKCPLPQVDLLVLGTSCKDMSRANPCQHKDSAVLSQQVSRGGSAQTFRGMLSYLQSKCPPLVLFENVDAMDDSKGTDMNNMDIFLAETSARGYESQVRMTDAAEFGCSARRRRIYVLLVRTAVNPLLDFTTRPLTAAFATFRALLLGCLRGGPCVTQILFQESSEPVQLELGLRLDKRAKQREKDAEKKQGAPAPPQSWVEQHMQFAQNHRVRWGQAVPAKLAANQWYQTLGDREQDALSLLQQCTPYIVFRDLSQSIVRGNSNTWRQDSSKHVMSTVLPRMVLWCEAQNRLVLGREALLMQGFPVQPFLQILAARMETMPLAQQWHPSEALMMDLAGNAMALPVVLAMVQCALAALNWKDRTLSGQAVQLALLQTEDSCWNVCWLLTVDSVANAVLIFLLFLLCFLASLIF